MLKEPGRWLILILLAAAFMRWHLITQAPPGMTHDEADHGVDAWGVVEGIRPIYFTVGYGREPLFDYSTAGLMRFLGPTYLAGRLTATFYGLLLVAGAYAWTRRAFGAPAALLTAAGLALSFWPIMTARQALRSVTMPALFVLAVLCFWQATLPPDGQRRRVGRWYAAAGLWLGIGFYSYLPARLLWLLFPAMLVYWAVTDRARLRQAWRGTLGMLALAAALAFPLFHYLYTTPTAEIRLSQLGGPLTAARQGNLTPLLHNIWDGLRLLTSAGDPLWRYNIPDRPLLTPLWGWLFYGGVLLALHQALTGRRYHSACALALLWLFLGLAPALITGVEAAATRVIGMQPVLYLFPTLSLVWGAAWLKRRAHLTGPGWRLGGRLAAVLLSAGLLADSSRAYFAVWANAPEVRVQYETTLVEMMHYLDTVPTPAVAAISSPQPNRFHDPAVAQMTLQQSQVGLRWFNGQASLLLPDASEVWLLYSAQAPLNAVWQPWLEEARLAAVLPLRPTDEDRPITILHMNGQAAAAAMQAAFQPPPGPTTFGDPSRVHFLGYRLNSDRLPPGGVLEVLTMWRVAQAANDAVLFTHVQGDDGAPLAQQDALDAPSYFWQAGDVFVQRHVIALPADLPPGRYPLAIGFYTRLTPDTTARWPVQQNGRVAGDILPLTSLTVTP